MNGKGKKIKIDLKSFIVGLTMKIASLIYQENKCSKKKRGGMRGVRGERRRGGGEGRRGVSGQRGGGDKQNHYSRRATS